MESSQILYNNDILISIIIPVYNVEKYIYECLLSVIEQDYKNIEIIIIDDGSTDKSFQICKYVKEKFKDRVIKIIQQENKGLSAARNVGMEIAKGEYILFVDSDDMLQKNAIKILKKYISQYNADLFLYDGVNKNETDREINEMEYQRSHCIVSRMMSGKKFMTDWYVHTHEFPVWLYLFRSDYIKNKSFLFTEGKYHEDISFGFKAVLHATSLMYIPDILYIKRCRPNSITTSKMSLKNYDGVLTGFEECVKEYSDFPNKTEALSNAVGLFWCIELEYVTHIYKEWGGDKRRAEKLYNAFLKELLSRNILHRGYTWFSSVDKLLKIGKKEHFIIENEIENKIESIIQGKEISEIREEKRLEIIKNFKFNNPSIKIGIFGKGNHSKALLEMFQKCKKVKAKIYFIDSNSISGAENFMGYKVFNYRDIPKDTNEVIISSFIYREEMLLLCYKMQNIIDFKIVDPYATEFYPIDEMIE